MKITLWGTRGSLASPGPETARYGGNTSCVQVEGENGSVLVLDSGTGIRRLGTALPPNLKRIDLLQTHLHMDHLQGLGFFRPLRTPGVEVHLWGPASTTLSLRARLSRYLSPPLFPVNLREVECELHLHEVPTEEIKIDGFRVSSAWVCHPDPTVGFRIQEGEHALAYLPDHEPALGGRELPRRAEWISGFALAQGVDLLIHDAQYTEAEYAERVGWGHSAISHTLAFARLARVRHLVPFHHDPSHTDQDLDRMWEEQLAAAPPPFPVTPGMEGMTFTL
jgi:phosphoribosyl 1,2-cyclic phosphodiesterase